MGDKPIMEDKSTVDDKYKFIIIPILSSMMPILSQVIDNNFTKILFLLISLTTIIFYYKNTPLSTNRSKIIFRVLISITTAILLLPYVKTKSFETYVSAFNNFLSNNSNDSENKTYYDEINTKLNVISSNIESLSSSNKNNEKIFNKINDIDSYINKMMLINEQNLFKKNENISEIAEIKDVIIDFRDRGFPDLDFKNINDIEQIAHIYKMKLLGDSGKLYYYSNVVEAFKLLEIDIDKYSINEMTLLHWNLQYLVLLINIQKDIQSKLSDSSIDKNQIHEELFFNFEHYKIKNGNYRDKTFYGNWFLPFKNENYSRIYTHINGRIENVLNGILENSK